MKSKIIFSLFVLMVFLSGLVAGFYGGILNAASPVIGQLWAGAKEMQAAISLIDKNELIKARNLLCSSIQTRLVIMDELQPIKSKMVSNSQKELESYLYKNIKKDRAEFSATCI